MKQNLSLLFLCMIAILIGCPESDEYRHAALGGTIYKSTTTTTTTIPDVLFTANKFFWGTWISMADGKAYNMQDQKIVVDNKPYWYKSGTDESSDNLVVEYLGKFVKQSDSVILNGAIPYFRQGGSNIEYKLKIVGINGGRAGATSTPLDNKTVTATSQTYASYTNSSTTDANGEVTLKAPTVNDVQTITVPKEGGGSIIVPGVKVETNGSNMGTIAVVQEGDYTLKVYGNVTNKDNGYMYAGKDYNMTLVIKNISDVPAETSFVTVSTEDDALDFDKANNENFNVKAGEAVATLAPGMEKQIKMTVQYNNIDNGYIDTGLKVTIKNTETDQVWEDYVPLRFFKGQYHWTINADSTEHNNNAALHGFLIYPDKSSQYFYVNDKSDETIRVPSFKTNEDYLLIFSGATFGETLAESSAMYYTVIEGDHAKDINRSDEDSITFGGNNNTEQSAFAIYSEFQAYLAEGKIKYFKIRGSNAITLE